MGKRNGVVLIDLLFSLSIAMMILMLVLGIFRNLKGIQLAYNNDLSYCLYSLSKEVSFASRVEVFEDHLVLYGPTTSEISLHDKRIVKTPGFNIFMHHVDAISFSNDENYVYMTLSRGDQCETFKVGVYKRPIYRVCEPDDTNLLPDISECEPGVSDDDSELYKGSEQGEIVDTNADGFDECVSNGI